MDKEAWNEVGWTAIYSHPDYSSLTPAFTNGKCLSCNFLAKKGTQNFSWDKIYEVRETRRGRRTSCYECLRESWWETDTGAEVMERAIERGRTTTTKMNWYCQVYQRERRMSKIHVIYAFQIFVGYLFPFPSFSTPLSHSLFSTCLSVQFFDCCWTLFWLRDTFWSVTQLKKGEREHG